MSFNNLAFFARFGFF